MGKVVRCDSCQNLAEFDSSADSEVNSWGECSSCGAHLGLHTGSTYYRCQCGRGLTGLSRSDIGEGTWVRCESCRQEYSIIPQSSRWDIYSCRRCDTKSVVSFHPGDFQCNCGKTLRTTLEDAKNGKQCRCPSCGFIWDEIDALWKLVCDCGLIDSAIKLPNRMQFSTPGKAGLSQSAIAASQSSSRGGTPPSRVDRWLDRAFKAGDPISMVANFVVETAEIGADAWKDSQARKSEERKNTSESSHQANHSTSDNFNEYRQSQYLKGDVNMDEFNAEEWFSNFAGVMTSQYQDHINALKTAGAKQVTSPTRVPVLTSREALLNSYQQSEAGSKVAALRLLTTAIAAADSGAVSPDPSEWPIDGPEIGRGHACMWGAIARVLAHKQAEAFTWQDATLSDSWFGAAFVIFLHNNEGTMAGRVLQEWAESRRLYGDEEGANILFLGATCVFLLSGNQQRLSLVVNRPNENGPVAMDSSFFLSRPATEQESRVLSSVLGARNTHKLFKSLA